MASSLNEKIHNSSMKLRNNIKARSIFREIDRNTYKDFNKIITISNKIVSHLRDGSNINKEFKKSKEKEKDKNEIKEEKKENTENLDQNINIAKLTEENSKPQENNNPISLGNSNENKIASIILSSPSNEQIDNLVKINPDEEITKSIDSQMNSLQNIISNLSKKLPSNNEAENEEEEESEFSNSNKNMKSI